MSWLFWWWITSVAASIITMLLIRVKFRAFMFLLPAAICIAWLVIPLFVLSFFLKFLRFNKLRKEDGSK